MKSASTSSLVRVVNGIYDDCVIDTGFFISDEKIDLLCEWLNAYATALEKAWKAKGSVGDVRKQKFSKVLSFSSAISKMRQEYDISIGRQEESTSGEKEDGK